MNILEDIPVTRTLHFVFTIELGGERENEPFLIQLSKTVSVFSHLLKLRNPKFTQNQC